MVKSGQERSEAGRRQRFRLKKLKFRRIKTWVLLVILVPLLFIDATLLRFDHLRMVGLRDAVLAADQEGDEDKIQTSLEELREFTFHNMVINVVEENGEQKVTFGTGPFYLENEYNRTSNQALEEAQSKLADDANPNGDVYAAAFQACQSEVVAWTTRDYLNCMLEELGKYPAAEELNNQVLVNLPSTELYRMNFASPVWAPTVTGFCILITIILIVVIFIRMVVWAVLKLSLLFI